MMKKKSANCWLLANRCALAYVLHIYLMDPKSFFSFLSLSLAAALHAVEATMRPRRGNKRLISAKLSSAAIMTINTIFVMIIISLCSFSRFWV